MERRPARVEVEGERFVQQALSAALKELATAIAGQDKPRIVALASRLSQVPDTQLPPGAATELQHALGAVLAEAGAGDAAMAAHGKALQGMASGTPDPRDVLGEIDALIALSEARGDYATAARLQAIAVELTRGIDGGDSTVLRARLMSLSRLRMRTGESAAAAAAAAEGSALGQREAVTGGPAAAETASRAESVAPPRPILAPMPVPASVARSETVTRVPGGTAKAASPPSPLDAALEAAGSTSLGAPAAETKAAPIAPPSPATGTGSDVVEVFFATSRTPTGSENPYRHFSGRRHGDVTPIHTYGIAEVSVPRQRKIGTMPTASWLNRHAGYQNDELYLLKAIREFADSDWRGAMTGRLTQKPGREALVYVHGFNVDFWEAMVRAAQLAADLDIDGVVAAYSWPSRGNVLGYPTDRQEIIAPHIDELRRMISTIAQTPGVGRVTVVAHSMGCEFLLPALKDLALERGGAQSAGQSLAKPLIKDVIFAAPDVDLAHFAGIVPTLSGIAGRVSVYCSEKDSALSWGRWLLMSHDRAGNQAGKLAATIAGRASAVDTIDTTEASADMIGHSDFASSAIDDLRGIVWLSLLPDRRPTLVEKRSEQGSGYWVYRAASSDHADTPFREALLLARRRGGVAPALAQVEKEMKGMQERPGGDPAQARRWAQIGQALTAMG